MTNKTLIVSSLFVVILAGALLFFTNAGITGKAIDAPVHGLSVPILFFYGQGCQHCAAEESFFKSIEGKYNLDLKEYEVYSHKENVKLLLELASAYGQEVTGVPVTFINEKIIVGYNSEIGKQIEDEIKKCSLQECPNPINIVSSENLTAIVGDSSPTENPSVTNTKKKLTIPAVIAAAAIDSINPCEFAVLLLLLTTILASGSRRRAFFAGLAFSAAIYISYFLMGLGLYSAIQLSGFTRIFYIVVSIIAIIVGLFNLKDYFWYGKWFVMEVPLTWRPKMKMLLRSVTSIPGAFLIGIVISLFLLPCTSGPYIVILGLLAEFTTRNYAIMLLLFYNAIFILPMIILTCLIAFGFATTEQAEEWRMRKIKVLHLIAGSLMIILGVVMLGAVLLGYL